MNSLRFFLTCLCFVFLGTLHAAQLSAEDYLHQAGAKYIQGRMQEASLEVEEAIRKFPNDSRLKALANQLKQMKDQQKKDQGGSSSQGGDQNKNQEDKKDSSGQKDSQNKKDEQKQKDQKKNQGQDKDKEKDKQPDDQKKNGDQDQKQPEPKDADKQEGQKAAPTKPGEMSKDDAERLLNSYQDDEKREHQNMQHRQRKPVSVEKDW